MRFVQKLRGRSTGQHAAYPFGPSVLFNVGCLGEKDFVLAAGSKRTTSDMRAGVLDTKRNMMAQIACPPVVFRVIAVHISCIHIELGSGTAAAGAWRTSRQPCSDG